MSNKDTKKREHSAVLKPLVRMEEKDKKTGGKSFQFFVAIIADLMAITDGMAVAWTAPMIPYFLSEKSHIPMTQYEAEWMESCLLIGAIVGLPITAFCVDRLGRKRSLLFGTSILIACWIVVAVVYRVEYIYAARFFKGIGLNMAFVAAPMYVGEIAHKSIRGFLSSLVFIMSHLGVVVIYSLGPYVAFYVPSVVSVVLLTIEIAVFSFIPESPYYLLIKNKPEEARESLKKFRGGDDDIEYELKEMMESIELDKQSTGGIRDLFLKKNYRKALTIMLVLNSAQLLASSEVIVMNLHIILENAGSLYMDSKLAAIVFSVIYFLSSVVASLVIDKFGRKILLVISSVLTGCSLFVLALYFNLKYAEYDTLPYSWVPIVSVMVYAAVFKFGMGIVPIVLTAEVFASKIKAVGMTIADGIYVVSSVLVLQVFFWLRDLVEMHLPLYIFCGCTFLTGLYVVFFLPETKGKSLDEIQRMLRGEKWNEGDKEEGKKEFDLCDSRL